MRTHARRKIETHRHMARLFTHCACTAWYERASGQKNNCPRYPCQCQEPEESGHQRIRRGANILDLALHVQDRAGRGSTSGAMLQDGGPASHSFPCAGRFGLGASEKGSCLPALRISRHEKYTSILLTWRLKVRLPEVAEAAYHPPIQPRQPSIGLHLGFVLASLFLG